MVRLLGLTAQGKFGPVLVEFFFFHPVARYITSTSAFADIDAHLGPFPPRAGRSKKQMCLRDAHSLSVRPQGLCVFFPPPEK